jgi:hypothetical protein
MSESLDRQVRVNVFEVASLGLTGTFWTLRG